MGTAPDDLHEWISFEDPDEDRTWLLDATFLLSAWSCVYGNGCQGVLTADASELHQGCCSYGAHFIDADDQAAVSAAVARLTPQTWQHVNHGRRGGWLQTEDDGQLQTRVVKGACIFLNRPGFEGGMGCAFHIAALAAGERPLDWKPDVCWQLPLRLVEHTDEHGHVTSTLREWKRRDWGDGGFEFHWWCTDSPEAFVGKVPVYEYLRDEIVELVGRHIYDLVVDQLAPRRRRTVLPHPALRRR
ncbi:MAG TPA: hypothetical protein VF855_10270 [Acidimicrobiales bacterium]